MSTKELKKRTLINVCGVSRSGTTMLDLMLGNSPNAFSCGEVYAWFRPWRRSHKKLKCSCGDLHCRVWEPLRGLKEVEFCRQAFDRLGVEFLVDSSKDEAWVVDTHRWANQRGFDVKNVLIWKDPVDLAFSLWKRGRPSNFWRDEFLAYHEHLRGAGIDLVSVNHLRLVQEPARMMKALCGYCGMEYLAGRENFWEKDHHYLFGSAGTLKQAREKKGTIKRTPEYPQEFIDAVGPAEDFAKDDAEVMSVVSWLNSRDVTDVASERHSLDNHRYLVKRPPWYFVNRFKKAVRYVLPRQE